MQLSGWVAILGSNGSFKEARNLGPTLVDVKAGKVLPLIDTLPTYDSDTQVLVGPVITVTPGVNVTRVWTVRNKTNAETDGEKTGVVASVEKVVVEALFSMKNDLLTLQGQPTLTKQQFRNFLKGLL